MNNKKKGEMKRRVMGFIKYGNLSQDYSGW